MEKTRRVELDPRYRFAPTYRRRVAIFSSRPNSKLARSLSRERFPRICANPRSPRFIRREIYCSHYATATVSIVASVPGTATVSYLRSSHTGAQTREIVILSVAKPTYFLAAPTTCFLRSRGFMKLFVQRAREVLYYCLIFILAHIESASEEKWIEIFHIQNRCVFTVRSYV